MVSGPIPSDSEDENLSDEPLSDGDEASYAETELSQSSQAQDATLTPLPSDDTIDEDFEQEEMDPMEPPNLSQESDSQLATAHRSESARSPSPPPTSHPLFIPASGPHMPVDTPARSGESARTQPWTVRAGPSGIQRPRRNQQPQPVRPRSPTSLARVTRSKRVITTSGPQNKKRKTSLPRMDVVWKKHDLRQPDPDGDPVVGPPPDLKPTDETEDLASPLAVFAYYFNESIMSTILVESNRFCIQAGFKMKAVKMN